MKYIYSILLLAFMQSSIYAGKFDLLNLVHGLPVEQALATIKHDMFHEEEYTATKSPKNRKARYNTLSQTMKRIQEHQKHLHK